MLSASAYWSLNVYAFLYQRFETVTIQWNPKSQKLVYTLNLKDLRLWITHRFIATMLFNFSCLFILFREIISPTHNVRLPFILFQIILYTVLFFWPIVTITSFAFGEKYVTFWNVLKVKITTGVHRKTSGLNLTLTCLTTNTNTRTLI